MYLALDPESDEPVVIRTFSEPFTAEERQALLAALKRLCDTPLDHDSIARPLACGIEGEVPYLVHTYFAGHPVDEYLAQRGPRPLSEVVIRVTHIAAAVDFAAAAGVHHGSMGPRDVIFASDRSGVAGFGLVQAVREARPSGNEPTTADDIYALAAMTYELLVGQGFAGGDVRTELRRLPLSSLARVRVDVLADALKAALSTDPSKWPTSALAFARTLHDAQVAEPVMGRLAFEDGDVPTGTAAKTESSPRPVRFATLDPDDAGVMPTQKVDRLSFDAPLHSASAHEDATVIHHSEVHTGHAERFAYSDDDHETVVLPRPSDAERAPAVEPLLVAPRSTGGSGLRVALASVAVAVIVLGTAAAGFFYLGNAGKRAVVGADQPAPATSPSRVTVDDDTIAPGSPAAGTVASPPVESPPVAAEPPAPVVPGPKPQDTTPATPTAQRGAPGGEARSVAPSPQVPSPPPLDGGSPGRVLVRSNPPGAQVLVDGQPRGATPVAIRGLELGAHAITISAPGYPAWERRITLTADRPAQSFDVVLADEGPAGPPVVSRVPGALQVESRPAGAQVWMDGALLGTTPLLVSEVGIGSHAVRIELPGYRSWSTSVHVNHGERTRVAASLEEK